MWLRHKRWQYLNPLAPHATRCATGRVYLCAGKEGGLVDVPYRSDAAELLNPSADAEALYEVAWDRYGVTFDAQGKEVEVPVGTPTVNGDVEEPTEESHAPPRKPGRPRKR